MLRRVFNKNSESNGTSARPTEKQPLPSLLKRSASRFAKGNKDSSESLRKQYGSNTFKYKQELETMLDGDQRRNHSKRTNTINSQTQSDPYFANNLQSNSNYNHMNSYLSSRQHKVNSMNYGMEQTMGLNDTRQREFPQWNHPNNPMHDNRVNHSGLTLGVDPSRILPANLNQSQSLATKSFAKSLFPASPTNANRGLMNNPSDNTPYVNTQELNVNRNLNMPFIEEYPNAKQVNQLRPSPIPQMNRTVPVNINAQLPVNPMMNIPAYEPQMNSYHQQGWGGNCNQRIQTYKIEMIQNLLEETTHDIAVQEECELDLPEEIKNELKKLKKNGLREKKFNLPEVSLYLIACQNKLYVWDYQIHSLGFKELREIISRGFLLKIVGRMSFIWIEYQDSTADVIQVQLKETESGEASLDIQTVLRKQKKIDSENVFWIAKMNTLFFAEASKQMGTLFYQEERKKLKTQRFTPPKNKQAGALKRVKKNLVWVFSRKVHYHFQIKVVGERLFIMKTGFKYDASAFKMANLNPLDNIPRAIRNKNMKKVTQSIYSFCMGDSGRLYPQGKLNLRKLFDINKAMINSQFHMIGGFDFNLRIVDFYVKDIPKQDILDRVLQKKYKMAEINSLDVVKNLAEELKILTDTPNPAETGYLSQNLVFLMENGIELEVQPFEAILKRIQIRSIKETVSHNEEVQIPQKIEYQGYLHKGEILFTKGDSSYIILK